MFAQMELLLHALQELIALSALLLCKFAPLELIRIYQGKLTAKNAQLDNTATQPQQQQWVLSQEQHVRLDSFAQLVVLPTQ